VEKVAYCYYRLGFKLYRLRRYRWALRAFEKAVKFDPSNSEYHCWKERTGRAEEGGLGDRQKGMGEGK
jgi:tetratricopeptide (TPR) repeat protein